MRMICVMLALIASPLVGLAQPKSQYEIPEKKDQFFVTDLSKVIDPESDDRIKLAQQEAFEKHDTPIIVVTIASMAEYGFKAGTPISKVAQVWFDAWRIGTMDRQGGHNRGILVLVSVGDRKARIELGADWGRSWDAFCQDVMSEQMVPAFKQGQYGDGIAEAVERLGTMAKAGPAGEVPQSWGGQTKKLAEYSMFPGWSILLMVVLGVALIVGGLFSPNHGKWMIICGIALILLAIFTYVILIVIAIFFRMKYGGGSSGGYSGGGFSGGFSGGGGASGSW